MRYNASDVIQPIQVNQTIEPYVDPYLIHLLELRNYFRMGAGILAPSIAFVGVCGNLVSIVVLTRRWLRSSTNCYLTTLAGYDILYLLCASVLFLKGIFGELRYNEMYMYSFWFVRPCSNVFSNTATWLTVTFTVERYIGVSSPIKGRVICTVERAKCIITGVCIAAFICTLPEFFTMELVSARVPGTNLTRNIAFKPTETHEFLQNVGYYWIVPLLFTFVPLLLLIIFNSLLINSVMVASRFRRENAIADSDNRRERQQREQQRITTMLIAVVLVFLTCQIPSAILLVIQKVYETTAKAETYRRHMAGAVFNLLIICNSSFNFILYSVFSTKFRNTFKRIFCKCVKDNASEQLFSEMHPNYRGGSRPSVCQRNSPNNSNVVTADRQNKNGYLQIGVSGDTTGLTLV